MNYCKKCGKKVGKTDKFCKSCGAKINSSIDTNKIILNIGVILILFSSVLFAFIKWYEFSSLFKILFLCFECLLFFGFSFVSKKLDNDLAHKLCYFLGIIFIPIIIYALNAYNFTISYFTKGAGLYIYLSIISFVCFILFLFSYKFIKPKFYLYLSIISIVVCVFFLIIGLNFNFNVFLLISLISVGVLTLLINKNIIKLKNVNSINIFFSILLICIFCVIIVNSFINKSLIFSTLILLVYILDIYLLNNKTFIKYISSILISVLLSIYSLLYFSFEISIYLIFVGSVLLYLSSYLYKEIGVKVVSLFMIFVVYISICVFSYLNYRSFFIINLLMILLGIFIMKIEKREDIKISFNIVLPISIFFFVYSCFNVFLKLRFTDMFLVSSIITYIFFLLYSKNKVNRIFEVYYVSYIIISTILLTGFSKFEITMIINLTLWLYYLVVNNFYIKNKALSYVFLSFSFISLAIILTVLRLPFVYVLMAISFLLFLYYELTKKKIVGFLLSGSIIAFICSLNNFAGYKSYGVLATSLLYAYSILNLHRLGKNYDVFKIISIFIGFFLIDNILSYMSLPHEIVCILDIIIVLFTLTVLYLAEKASNKRILLYSLFMLLPYYTLVSDLYIFENVTAIYMFPVIIYSLVVPEILDIKDKTNFVFVASIVLSIFTLGFGYVAMIINLLIFLIYIIYSSVKKNVKMTYFSIIYLLLLLIFGLYSIINSVTIILLILIIGITLIVYSMINKK